MEHTLVYIRELHTPVADPEFGKGGMCTVPTMPPFDELYAMKVAAAVLTASNCSETVSLFANYTSSKGVSMETVETPLDPPLHTSHTVHYDIITPNSGGGGGDFAGGAAPYLYEFSY